MRETPRAPNLMFEVFDTSSFDEKEQKKSVTARSLLSLLCVTCGWKMKIGSREGSAFAL